MLVASYRLSIFTFSLSLSLSLTFNTHFCCIQTTENQFAFPFLSVSVSFLEKEFSTLSLTFFFFFSKLAKLECSEMFGRRRFGRKKEYAGCRERERESYYSKELEVARE